jgi:hypothetical protein
MRSTIAAPAAIEGEETSVTATQGRRKMGTGALRTVLASAATLLVLSVLPCASAGAAESAVAPLPASDYTVRHVCPAPAPGYASCLALELVPKTAAARARTHPLGITSSRPIMAAKASEGAFGLRPQDLHSIYDLPGTAASAQTIALVDAYNDPNAEADLKVYDEEFRLPECTGANKCFEQVNQKGQSKETGKLPFPESNEAREADEATCETGTGAAKEAACEEVEEAVGWGEEMSLDIEVSHATCESCKIILVEADSASFEDLDEAEQAAAALGATEISNSWGGPEQGVTAREDNASPFNDPGTVITASAGDDGYLDWDAEEGAEKGFADYPASSPHVVAVGGTRLQGPLGPGRTWAGETVWNGDGAGGGGCSETLAAAPWQLNTADWESIGCGQHRAVADVSADADPYTGVAVYDSSFKCEYEEGGVVHVVHWCTIGGTSLASPLIASVFALAGGAGGVAYPAETLYENEAEDPTTLHDIVSGSNGECTQPFNKEDGLSGCTALQEAASCSEKAICLAREGYDGPTGVGTPNGLAAFEPVSEEAKRKTEEKRHAEKQLREEKQHEEERQREEKKQEEAATKNPGGGSTTGTSTTGAGSISAANGAKADPSGTTTLSIAAGAPTIKLTAFALTPSALLALNRARPKVSEVGFAFTLSAAAHVRVAVAKLLEAHGRKRWQTLPYALTLAGARGRDRERLSAHGVLTPGSYRMTLTPEHGSARSITFQIG